MRKITTVAAKCANCCQSFCHPSLGDFSYGQAVLSTTDGRHFATVDAFAEFPQLAAALAGQSDIWPILASLADPIARQSLSASIHCPHCGSARLESWGGSKSGSMLVPEATFIAASSLSKDLLAARITAVTHGPEA
jgi:ribosomal protein S27E